MTGLVSHQKQSYCLPRIRGWDVSGDMAHTVAADYRRLVDIFGLEPPGVPFTIYVEPGRGLVGRAAVALYRVVGTKRVPDVRTFVAVDGGMGDNIRPALYDAEYTAVLAARAIEKATEEVTVAGRYCESGDVLIRSVRLPTAHSGDVLAMPATGAYSVAMSSNYNETPRPAVVLLDGDRARVIRERESIADIWRLERR